MIETDTFRGLTCKEKDGFAVKFRCKTCGAVTWVKGENMNIGEKFMDRMFMDGSYVWNCPVCKFGMTSIDFAPVETIFDK